MNYTHEVESMMLKLYSSLNEKDRRRYAAIEVIKLGYGGKQYIMDLFSCSHHTIDKGLWELDQENKPLSDIIRNKGGGRKKKAESLLGMALLKEYLCFP
jgi:hypothetical protein